MDFFIKINNFNYFFNLYLAFSEEIIIVFLFYNFIKLLIFSSVFELIWPTQFFNKRNNFLSLLKFRNFNEYFTKLRLKSFSKKIINNFFNFFFFVK